MRFNFTICLFEAAAFGAAQADSVTLKAAVASLDRALPQLQFGMRL